MKNANSPTSPKRAAAAERRRKAVALRIAGATYEQIGRELGITPQAAWKHVTVALADVREKTAEDADILRVVELARLDAAQASIWSRVVQGDNQAIDRFLRISKRRSEITGMDAPVKQDITTDGKPIILEWRTYDDDDAKRADSMLAANAQGTSGNTEQ